MKRLLAMMALITIGAQPGISQERSISGRVVNAEGEPVANVSVATFWRANGSAKKSDGTEFDLQDKAQLREYWVGLVKWNQTSRFKRMLAAGLKSR